MNRKHCGRGRLGIALVFFLVTTVCLIWGVGISAAWLSIQQGPAWVKFIGDMSVTIMALTLAMIGLTFIFGRYFCAILCPLGTFQDLVCLVFKNSQVRIRNFKILRYAIAAFSLAILIGGWVGALRLLEPFSRLGAFVAATKELLTSTIHHAAPSLSSGHIMGGILPTIILVCLVWRWRRVYCVSLCPVGTVLGVVAKYSIYRFWINETCTKCGRCEKQCPTSAINGTMRIIDNERCVMCLNCLSTCGKGSIVYGKPPRLARKTGEVSVNGERRRFLISSASVAIGVVALGSKASPTIRNMARVVDNVDGLILPPGAYEAERFARLCTGCQACVASCPAKVIKPSPYGFGPVRLDYTSSGCLFDCTLCNNICPSGALKAVDLTSKQWLKIGEAIVDTPKCRVVKDGEECTLCVKACPMGAIFLMDGSRGLPVPEVAAFHCIGCGACQAACPMQDKAVVVKSVSHYSM